MSAIQLDHVTLVTPDLESARRFFCDVAGLCDGPRPPFRVNGHWLYADDRAVIHLVGSAMRGEDSALVAPRLDHVAFRIAPGEAWHALLARLAAHRVRYQVAHVPERAETQIFVALAPGVAVEFISSSLSLPNG